MTAWLYDCMTKGSNYVRSCPSQKGLEAPTKIQTLERIGIGIFLVQLWMVVSILTLQSNLVAVTIQ